MEAGMIVEAGNERLVLIDIGALSINGKYLQEHWNAVVEGTSEIVEYIHQYNI